MFMVLVTFASGGTPVFAPFSVTESPSASLAVVPDTSNTSSVILSEPLDVTDDHSLSSREVAGITDAPVPLAEGSYAGATWAPLNLLCALASTLWSVVLLVSFIIKRRRHSDVGKKVTTKTPSVTFVTFQNLRERPDKHIKYFGGCAIGVLSGIISLVAFMLTEDVSLPITWVDSWSPLMVALLIIQDFITLYAVVCRSSADESLSLSSSAQELFR
jgi:hypothetical protein